MNAYEEERYKERGKKIGIINPYFPVHPKTVILKTAVHYINRNFS